MKNTVYTLATAMALAFSAPAMAQDHASHAGHGTPGTAPVAAAAAVSAGQDVMTAGEVTRVDARSGKLTIRHEEIQNLDMPPMTMVFGLQDPALAAQFKPGDRVLFHAEDQAGALRITRIQAAP